MEGHGVGQEEHHQDEVRGDELGGELEQDRDAAQDSLADVADEEPEREPDEVAPFTSPNGLQEREQHEHSHRGDNH